MTSLPPAARLGRRAGARRSATPLSPALGGALDRALARAPQAEWGLAHQGAEVLLSRDQGAGWLARRLGRRLVALGLPLGPPDLDGLRSASGAAPLLYKCDGRTAVAARVAGWRVLRLGSEAILDLDAWTASRPACRRLRRKLRAAAGAGVVVAEAPDPPLGEMAAVAAEWVTRQGPERGFSMGRFDPSLVARQRALVARHEGRPVAFATFHLGRDEWALDLMRHRATIPDGTMHAIVAHAVALARACGASRLCLAAVPPTAPEVLGRLAARLPPRAAGRCGLRQFKLAFGPRLAPRYAAAPHGLELAAGLVAVARAIRRPADPTAEPRRPPSLERSLGPCDALRPAIPAAGPPARP